MRRGHEPCPRDSPREAPLHRRGRPPRARGTACDQGSGTHPSVHTVGLASNGQTSEAQLTSSWVLSLPHSPYDGEGDTGLPTALGHKDGAALWRQLFLVKEQEAEPAVGCPPGVRKPKDPKEK